MKTLYIDCSNGVSGDTMLKALEELAEQVEHDHGDHDHHHHGRSYEEVKNIIDRAQKTAHSIYEVIAKAEATVHEKTLETVHFHEVGRDEAIKNAMGIGMALAKIKPDRIIASAVNDGKGFIDCAHGRIPVPVPAVRAMMDECGKAYPAFAFNTCEEVETEMVTPSGLASLIGIGALPADGMMFMQGSITAQAEAEGTRNTGRGGLRMYLIEK